MGIFEREVGWSQGFAILRITILPRGQVALRGPEVQVSLDFYTFRSYFSSMKEDQKSIASDPGDRLHWWGYWETLY